MEQNEQTNTLSETVRQGANRSGYAQLLGMQIEVAEAGRGRVRLRVDERLLHPQQIVHGGALFSIADTAMAMALLPAYPPGTRTSTLEAKINFLRAVRSGELVAEAAIVHRGRSTAVLEATVYNYETGDGAGEPRTIARLLATFYIIPPENVSAEK